MVYSADQLQIGGILAFGACIVMLDLYDSSLNRRERVGVAGVLVAACILTLGAFPALILGVVGTLAGHVRRLAQGEMSEAFHEVGVRLVATIAGVGVSALYRAEPAAWERWMQILAVPSVYLIVELFAQQFARSLLDKVPFNGIMAGTLSRRSQLVASEISVSALAVILYEGTWVWSLLPVLAILVLISQAYVLLLGIRETYYTTISVLVDAAESSEPGLKGHSERVASMTREMGKRCGLTDSEFERASFAALLHDLARINEGQMPESGAASSASAVVSDVGFLSEVVPVLQALEGDKAHFHTDKDMLAAYIVALANDIDAENYDLVRQAHPVASVSIVSQQVPPQVKARAVAAAVTLGYPVPAID